MSKLKTISLLFVTVLFSIFLLNFNFTVKIAEKSINLLTGPTNGANYPIGVMQSLHNINDGNYDELKANFTHMYIGTISGEIPYRHTPGCDWLIPNQVDDLTTAVPTDVIKAKLNDIYLHNGTRVLWMRPKIEWLAYGQSSTNNNVIFYLTKI